MKKYFLLSINEDGDVSLSEWSHTDLVAALNEHDFGFDITFAGSVPKYGSDVMTSKGRFWLIEGRLIQPVAQTVVTEYRLPE